MVDIEKLKRIIKDSGISVSFIAEKAGMSRGTLYTRFDGYDDFRASEIEGITKALKLSKDERDSIFFADDVELKSS